MVLGSTQATKKFLYVIMGALRFTARMLDRAWENLVTSSRGLLEEWTLYKIFVNGCYYGKRIESNDHCWQDHSFVVSK